MDDATVRDDDLCDLQVREAVTAVDLPIAITEILGPTYRSWHAEIQIDPVMLDGHWPYELPDTDPDYNTDVPRGYGATRADALADLLRAMRRITWGVVIHPEPARLAVRLVSVAWSGTGLVVVNDPAVYPPRP